MTKGTGVVDGSIAVGVDLQILNEAKNDKEGRCGFPASFLFVWRSNDKARMVAFCIQYLHFAPLKIGTNIHHK